MCANHKNIPTTSLQIIIKKTTKHTPLLLKKTTKQNKTKQINIQNHQQQQKNTKTNKTKKDTKISY
jgi:hypothetical protein